MAEHLNHDPKVNCLNPSTGREKMKRIINYAEWYGLKGVHALDLLSYISYQHLASLQLS
jgi:hypothetical protein